MLINIILAFIFIESRKSIINTMNEPIDISSSSSSLACSGDGLLDPSLLLFLLRLWISYCFVN